MNQLEQEARRVRREVLARERAVQRELVAVYGQAIGEIRGQLDDLKRLIGEARSQRDPARWIARQQRLEGFLNSLQQQLAVYTMTVTLRLTALQRQNVSAAVDDALALMRAALGPGNGVWLEYRPPNPSVTAQVIGNAADGTPLGDVLNEIAGGIGHQARRELAVGVALGHSPTTIARRLTRTTGTALARTKVIARQEGLRAYRETSTAAFAANPDVVTAWRWQATFDVRTCPMCWAMSGREFPADQAFESHICCRCVQVPVTVSWADLGFDVPDHRPTLRTGPDAFASLSNAEQRLILGPGKYNAYASGRAGLPDFVRRTHSQRWGAGRRTATLDEALQPA